ncbi:hypothetical protein [Yersinia mollaretii]|uniref:hypothetical protein n=1 Tax=Yersinia mollaretii TaxID=33060 RepID=UPI0005DFBAF0|nr:hypothetical protein [Yersinia mollaretii]MDN0109337.1 hypothetical protein [Yersinia mollaretii]PJE87675.1 hypothetical protein CU280_11650 [Yersinia mollaretii]CQD38180.1 Uncharacterised protein [Yersinia mollaretii]CQH09986.1 Uncharacterised protein [Yersinia mollaretii]
MLKISNTILVSIALGFIITCFNAHAVKPISAIMEQGASLAPLAMNAGDSALPEFTVNDVRSTYHLVENNAIVDFIISSNELLNYYAYVRKNNVIYGDASGFVNNRSVGVVILAKEINVGNYELVIDVYNNDKLSANKIFTFLIVQ